MQAWCVVVSTIGAIVSLHFLARAIETIYTDMKSKSSPWLGLWWGPPG